nr:hypothetical protein [Tanacetum cinerariifolium]
MLYHYKLGLLQVEARLVEFTNQEINFCKKIRGLEFKVESKDNRIKRLTNKLEELKKEKEGLDSKLTGFQSASKELDTLIGSQRSDKNKEGLGYNVVSLFLLKPSPSIESNSNDLQSSNSSVSKNGESSSSILSKHVITFVKVVDSPTVIKTNKDETVRKYSVKYAEMYRKTSKSFNVRGKTWAKNNYSHKSRSPRTVFHKTDRTPMRTNRPNMDAAQPKRTSFTTPAHSYIRRTFQRTSAVRTQFRVPRVSTVNTKFPTVNRKFPTGNSKFSNADLGTKGKADSGWSTHMTGNISYISDYEPYDGGYVSFGQGGGKITGKGIIKTGKLEFENVYFVKDLKYNLFSVSQICNNKNNVLFTDSKCIMCDNEGEFRNKEMNDFCSRKGIRREFSNARTLQQNGVAERRNRTLIEAAKTMVLVNKSQNKTPYELFNGRTLAIGFLKPFGCHVMILNTLDHLGKFDAKRDEGYFIGYSMSSKAFRVFNKRTKRVEENLHVDFLENKLIEKGACPNWLFDIDTLTNSMNYVPVVVAGTSSTNFSGTKDAASQDVKKDVSSLRYITLPNWFHDAHLESSTSNAQDACNTDAPKSSGNSNPTATSNNPLVDQIETLAVETAIPTVSSPVLTACLDDSPKPSSDTRLISKRVTSQDDTPSLDNILNLSNRFEDILGVTTNTDDTNGVEANLGNMEYNIAASPTPTFRIHKDHPKSVRPIGTKWVLKNKKDKRGIVIRNKARLVAQGHTQEEGINHEEVFAPVARIESIRLFLAYASFMGFIVYQMDVKSAFLYGTIDEEVYVMQRPGFQDLEFPARVYKVEKAMYGLHQAPRAWYGTLSKYLLTNGFQRGKDGTGKDVDLHLYRSMIGSLMYLTASRPDIMFAVCACARHQVTPKECHLHAVKRIFRYLKGHPKLGLWYLKESPFDLVAYSDSDYGGATQDRKSTTRGCQFLGRRLISWQCKK